MYQNQHTKLSTKTIKYRLFPESDYQNPKGKLRKHETFEQIKEGKLRQTDGGGDIGAAVAVALVVEDLDLELLVVHVVRVGDDELERLVPDRVEVLVLGRRPLPLPVEVRHHVSAGAALAIFW